MDYPFLQLAIFLLLAIVDTGNAIYYRYVVKVETKVSISDRIVACSINLRLFKPFNPF